MVDFRLKRSFCESKKQAIQGKKNTLLSNKQVHQYHIVEVAKQYEFLPAQRI